MKILLFNFFKVKSSILIYRDHFYHWLVSNLPEDKIDVKFLMNEKQYNENVEQKVINDSPIECLTYNDINYIFQQDLTFEEIFQKIHFNDYTINDKKRLKEVFENKFGDWIPDIIVGLGYFSTKLIWNDIFPKALCLTQENAIFSRDPFTRTLSYEPYNHLLETFLNKYKNDILKIQISQNESNKLKNFRKDLSFIIDKNSKIKNKIKIKKRKFKYLVLLPLSYGIKFCKEYIYGNDLELIDYVLSNVSNDIGIIVTQHEGNPVLNAENIKYFSNKYPNFIYLGENNSLLYYKYVDAVFCAVSKVNTMALLYDKPVISLAKTYNDWLKDGQGIEDLEKILTQPKKDKNNILYWYLTHYIIFEKDFYKENFLYDYLRNKLEKYRKDGINFEFFDKINDIDDITKYTIDTVKEYYKKIEQEKREVYILKMKHYITQLKQYFMQKIMCIKSLLSAIIRIMRLYIC